MAQPAAVKPPTGTPHCSGHRTAKGRLMAVGVDQVHRRCARGLVLPAHLPAGGIPHPIGQHGEHAAGGGLPVREQAAVRGRDTAHRQEAAGGARAAPQRDPRLRFGRGAGAQGGEAAHRRARRHAGDGGGSSDPQRSAESTSRTPCTPIRRCSPSPSSASRCAHGSRRTSPAGRARATIPTCRTGDRSWCRPTRSS